MTEKFNIRDPRAAQAILKKAAELRRKDVTNLFEKKVHTLTDEEWAWFKRVTHSRQFEILKSDCRFQAVLTPRRWGKCLVEGTLVATPQGPRPIEQLAPGDQVYGWNFDDSVSITTVAAVWDQGTQEVVDLKSRGVTLASCTRNHPWLSQCPVSGEFKVERVCELGQTPIVNRLNGIKSLIEVTISNLRIAQCYDITVANETNLYLLANGLVTHNTTNGLFQVVKHDKKFPGSTMFYIVPDSKSHARRLFWRPFMQMERQLKLGYDFHETDKRITTPSGSDILLFGAHDKDAAIQFRGDQSGLSLAILDECKDFGPHFEEVVVEAVLPALRDWGGTLVLQGSAGNVLDGLFYRLTSAPEDHPDYQDWLRVVGHVRDNTFAKEDWHRDPYQIWLREYKPFGLTMDSPRFRREILAEWCTDDTERVYLYDNVRNHYDFDGEGPFGLPIGISGQQHEWFYVIGIDLGEKDANAFVVFAFALTCKNVFVMETYAQPGMSIDSIAAKYRELDTKYGGFALSVADTYGYGRGIVTDLQTRLGLPLVAADKKGNKLGNIAQMNGDFLSGRLKCHRDSPIAKEWAHLVKKVRLSDHKVVLTHSDLGDAGLYGWKACQNWAAADMKPIPLPGSLEKAIEDDRLAAEKAVERRNGRGKAPSERGNY